MFVINIRRFIFFLFNRITQPHCLLRSLTSATTSSELCNFVLSFFFLFRIAKIEMISEKKVFGFLFVIFYNLVCVL